MEGSTKFFGLSKHSVAKQGLAGFTLIEVLITISIMALITGTALLNANQTSQTAQLTNAADVLRDAIYQAHNLALAPAVDRTSQSDGYQIIFTNPSGANYTTYTINESSYKNDVGVLTAGKQVAAGKLPAGYSFTPLSPAGLTSIEFRISNGGQIVWTGTSPSTYRLAAFKTTAPTVRELLTINVDSGQVSMARG